MHADTYYIWGVSMFAGQKEVKPLATLSKRLSRARRMFERDKGKFEGVDMLFMARMKPDGTPSELMAKR